METRVLREITPLSEHDFMYVADRHKKDFDYPIHIHDVLELNFVAKEQVPIWNMCGSSTNARVKTFMRLRCSFDLISI